MAGIYGPITEHPEYPETDARRFTVTIQPHPAAIDALRGVCYRCGYPELHPVHPHGQGHDGRHMNGDGNEWAPR